MLFERNDIEIMVNLLGKHKEYITSKFRHDEIETVTDSSQRIWIGILNSSLSHNIFIQKTNLLDIL